MAKPRVSREAQEQADMVELMGYAAFRRFLFRVAVAGDMLAPAGGSEDRHLRIAEGRRILGFEIFRWADESSLASHPSALPVNALALVLRDAVQPPGGSNVEVTDQSEDEEPDVQR